MIRLSPEVEAALSAGRAVVALESTLLAHGLPAARRAAASARIEAAVRGEGATPATIAILDGALCAGLDEAALARVIGGGVRKASLRDLAVAVAAGGVWATTVASTMAIAALAGIRMFATGGIGGVHRDAAESFDESADLMALARYPVGVVCAGPKAILDLPRTVERLETLGVPVIGYGTRVLPEFYHAGGRISLQHAFDTVEEIASVLRVQLEGLALGGALVVQPPPAELAQDPARIEALIAGALERAAREGVRGSAVTPFLLAALDEATSGDVVETNLALVEANARLASRLAVALADATPASA